MHTDYPIEYKIEIIRRYFEKQVNGYILGDLGRLMQIQPDENGNAGCAAPSAMAILSAIELFGTLLQENPRRQEGSTYSKNYILEYIPEIEEGDIECLRVNFRNKHMHVFFPNYSTDMRYGITKNARVDVLLIKTEGQVILNVQKLYELFVESVNKLRKHLLEERFTEKVNPFFKNIFVPETGGSISTTTQTTLAQ